MDPLPVALDLLLDVPLTLSNQGPFWSFTITWSSSLLASLILYFSSASLNLWRKTRLSAVT